MRSQLGSVPAPIRPRSRARSSARRLHTVAPGVAPEWLARLRAAWRRNEKTPPERGFLGGAADGIRTHDLLRGKQDVPPYSRAEAAARAKPKLASPRLPYHSQWPRMTDPALKADPRTLLPRFERRPGLEHFRPGCGAQSARSGHSETRFWPPRRSHPGMQGVATGVAPPLPWTEAIRRKWLIYAMGRAGFEPASNGL